MGINNLARFFRDSMEMPQTLPRRYNLAIDATLLLIPMLKISHTVTEFVVHFNRYFEEQPELREVLVSSSEIFVGLDYYYPAMKRDTCRKRQREYRRQQQRVTKHHHHHHRSSKEKSLSLHLKQVRDLIEPLFVDTVARWCRKPIVPALTFDVLGYGEGEIKCFKHREWKNNKLPTIILSNDNDVLLMILMHGATSYRSSRTKYFRIATTSSSCVDNKTLTFRSPAIVEPTLRMVFEHERYVLQHVSLKKLLQTLGNGEASISKTDMFVYECNAWILVTWLIATYGSDYVQSIRSSEPVVRHWLNNATSIFRNTNTIVPLNPHNFFRMLMMLFDVIADTERSVHCMNHCSEPIPVDDAQLHDVYHWCVRVYWNILYLFELPIDFTRQFVTDHDMPVNVYTNKRTLDESTIRALNVRQQQQLHNMFCVYSRDLQRYEKTSPAKMSVA